MENKDINEILKDILGTEAISNDMQISETTTKLAQAVNYLIIQLKMTKKIVYDDNDLLSEQIEIIINNTKQILSNK